MAEIAPNEGLDLILAGFPGGGAGPATTWLGLFTAFTASTVAGAAATIADWQELPADGGYTRIAIPAGSWGVPGAMAGGRGVTAAQASFPQASTAWGTVNGFIITNSPTVGAGVVYYGANPDDTTAIVVQIGDIVRITPRWAYTG